MAESDGESGGTGVAESALESGRVFAERYRLEGPIGTGGSGTIWRATHLTLGRPVALKLVEMTGPRQAAMRERFLREARVAAAIRHRNVVDIIDFGTEGTQPFMVMELLEGHTLARHLERGKAFTVGEAVRVIAPVLSGLGAVHESGIVHRDLKPENILLVEDADGWFPKLIDFGVSRVLDPAAGLESVLPTRDDVIVGTPQYMAPEQARGLSEIDHRADIWSAGVILFELLSGTLPFDADAVGDVLIEVATAEIPRLGAVRPELDGPFDRLIARALDRDPDARFQSAAEMRAAVLEAVKETASDVLERPPSVAPGPPDPVDTPTRGDDSGAWDVDSVSDDLDLIDERLSSPGRRRRASRDQVTVAAASGRSQISPGRWIWLAAVLLLAAGVGFALLYDGGDPEAPAEEPRAQTARPPETPAEPPPVAVELPEQEEEPEPDEAEEPDQPAPARAPAHRRRARVLRDPGF